MHTISTPPVETYEVIGVGFGPAGIALAVAMEDAEEERPSNPPWRSLFLEQAPDSAWQPEMLLPNTDITASFPPGLRHPEEPAQPLHIS